VTGRRVDGAVSRALVGVLVTLAGCSGGEGEPSFARGARASSTSRPSVEAPPAQARSAEAPATGAPPATPPAEGAPIPPPGRWYALVLPEGATRVASSAPEVIDATYELDAAEGLRLAVFRPMPAQDDLEAWTTATERILDGIPRRHDDAMLDGVPARLGTFEDQLRWTFVADGTGGLLRCFADGPRDEAWLRERCDPVVASFRLTRPIRP
jgi:hypothetical protein